MSISTLREKLEQIFPTTVSFQLDSKHGKTYIAIECDDPLNYVQLVRLSLTCETLSIQISDSENGFNLIEVETTKQFNHD